MSKIKAQEGLCSMDFVGEYKSWTRIRVLTQEYIPVPEQHKYTVPVEIANRKEIVSFTRRALPFGICYAVCI
jgi:hypothetical protein